MEGRDVKEFNLIALGVLWLGAIVAVAVVVNLVMR